MEIIYRIANDTDVPAMSQFWSENSGWDVIDAGEWRRRFTNGPCGDAIVSLAVDKSTAAIIGQFVFIPFNVSVVGKIVKSFRPFAPILKVSLQTKFGISALLTGSHPLLKMYLKITEELSQQGVPFIFIIPDPRWTRVLKAFPNVMTNRFPLYTLRLPLAQKMAIGAEYNSKEITANSNEIDDLWVRASSTYTSMIMRSSKLIEWRTQFGDFKIYAVYSQNSIAGFFAAVFKAKDHQWLICDLVAIDTGIHLKITLYYACNILSELDEMMNLNNAEHRKISILATSPMEKILIQAGFEKNDYHFTLAVHQLNKTDIDRKNIHPSEWYVSAND
jgi:hypothetical protein